MLWKRTGLIPIMCNPVFNLNLRVVKHRHQAFYAKVRHHLREYASLFQGIIKL